MSTKLENIEIYVLQLQGLKMFSVLSQYRKKTLLSASQLINQITSSCKLHDTLDVKYILYKNEIHKIRKITILQFKHPYDYKAVRDDILFLVDTLNFVTPNKIVFAIISANHIFHLFNKLAMCCSLFLGSVR